MTKNELEDIEIYLYRKKEFLIFNQEIQEDQRCYELKIIDGLLSLVKEKSIDTLQPPDHQHSPEQSKS